TRFLSLDNIGSLLSQLCLQSPDFGFKISTETQTLELTTPGGDPAQTGRDYKVFDMGLEVYSQLGGPKGAEFVRQVLHKRSVITDGVPSAAPADVLGRQSLRAIAQAIRSQPGKTAVYWGVDALAGVCVGDIGDILHLYAQILQRHQGSSFPVAPEVQHRVMV